MAPFEVLYGYHPRDFGVISLLDSEVPDLTSWLHRWEIMNLHLQQQLAQAQVRQKHHVDK